MRVGRGFKLELENTEMLKALLRIDDCPEG